MFPARFPPAAAELHGRAGAHTLAHDSGFDATAPDGFTDTSSGWQDLLRAPVAPVTVADALYEGMGYEPTPQERPSYPGIAQLARDMGLK